MQDEYLDIVDENDNVIGKDWRSSIYAKGLNYSIRVVNVFIFNSEKKLLVPKRSMNRRIYPRCFDFSCAEHVSSGEDYYQAAKRGLEEELGIRDLELIELGKLTPKAGVSCFMKVYKSEYNEDITNYDKDGNKILKLSFKHFQKAAFKVPDFFDFNEFAKYKRKYEAQDNIINGEVGFRTVYFGLK